MNAALAGDTAATSAAATTLAGVGIAVTRFERAVDLANAPEGYRPTVIVLELEQAQAQASLGETLASLRPRFEQTPLVLLCPAMERWEVRATLQAGVGAVVPRDALELALAPCVAAVLAGQVCVPRESWRQIDPPALSTREKQILGLVVMGYMNSQIADRLYLAESTVKSHLSSAFGKLGVRSRNEAVELILDPERGLGTGVLAIGGEPLDPPGGAVEQIASGA